MESNPGKYIGSSVLKPISVIISALTQPTAKELQPTAEMLYTDLNSEKPWYKQPFTIARNLLVALSEGLE